MHPCFAWTTPLSVAAGLLLLGCSGGGKGTATGAGASGSVSASVTGAGGTMGATTASSGGAGGKAAGGGGNGGTGAAGGSGSCPGAGTPCAPANACDLGVLACAGTGGSTCHDTGPNPDPIGCASGMNCQAGACAPCQTFQPCAVADVCRVGNLACDDPSSGQSTCFDEGPAIAADGVSCGACSVCSGGACTASAAGHACVPTNLCHKGTLSCGSSATTCTDTGPDPSRDAVACAYGKLCLSGACVPAEMINPSGLDVHLAPDQHGGVVAAPNVVMITYDNDPNRPTLEGYATWLATSGYLATVGAEYGVGNGTAVAAHVNDQPPASGDAATIVQYLTSHLNDPGWPPAAPNNIYTLLLPVSWSGTSTFCMTVGGYHSASAGGGPPAFLYAIIAEGCGTLEDAEVGVSHEVVEASTDPYINTYTIEDAHDPWTLLGGEVADLCVSNGTHVHDPSNTYSAQLIWSNVAAEQGKVPCVPWTGGAYLALNASPSTVTSGAPGSTVTFTLTGWASAPYNGQWQLVATEADVVDFASSPQLVQSTIGVNGTAQIRLSIPASATTGQRGGAWVLCYDPNAKVYVGSTMVGVVSL